jgi:HPt (histidine-containing phosphotransfer) domain-containing protein
MPAADNHGRSGIWLDDRYVSAAHNLDRSIEMSTETMGAPAIDMRAITQIADSDEMGGEFIAEIIEVFLADLSERVRTIGLQLKQGDRAGIAATAHAIKGSCGHFGAVRLVELSRDLEDRAKRDPTGDLQAALDSMLAETERVRAALGAYRSNPVPR